MHGNFCDLRCVAWLLLSCCFVVIYLLYWPRVARACHTLAVNW